MSAVATALAENATTRSEPLLHLTLPTPMPTQGEIERDLSQYEQYVSNLHLLLSKLEVNQPLATVVGALALASTATSTEQGQGQGAMQ